MHQLTLMVPRPRGLLTESTAGIPPGPYQEVGWSLSPSRRWGGGVQRLSNGSGGLLMPSQKPIRRSQQRVIGAKLLFSTPGTLVFQLLCRKETLLACSRQGESVVQQISLAAAVSTKISRTCCGLLRLQPALEVSRREEELIVLWRRFRCGCGLG